MTLAIFGLRLRRDFIEFDAFFRAYVSNKRPTKTSVIMELDAE